MALTHEQVRDALSTIQDPDLGKDLVTLGMVKTVEINEDAVQVGIEAAKTSLALNRAFKLAIQNSVPVTPATADVTP